MKTKLGASLVAALMMMGMFGVSSATAATGPDANGPAKKGLCTAYFNGSDTGRANKRSAPPFQNLQAAAEALNETVEAFCGVVRNEDTGTVEDNGLVGGNPDYEEPTEANPNSRGGRA